jgi:hypothetical protein
MIGQIFKDLLDSFLNPNLTKLVQNTPPEVRLRHQQRLQRNIIAVFDKRIRFQELFGLVSDFGGISDQQALIKGLDRSERRSISENDIEKSKPIDMPPKYHETNRERRR